MKLIARGAVCVTIDADGDVTVTNGKVRQDGGRVICEARPGPSRIVNYAGRGGVAGCTGNVTIRNSIVGNGNVVGTFAPSGGLHSIVGDGNVVGCVGTPRGDSSSDDDEDAVWKRDDEDPFTTIDVSGAARVTSHYEHTGPMLIVYVSGAARLSLKKGTIEDINLDACGAARADIGCKITGEASIDASGAAKVTFRQRPKILTKSLCGAATVTVPQ